MASDNNLYYLLIALLLMGLAVVIHYWHLIVRSFKPEKEALLPNEEDSIL